jgi:hypothetical protein
MDARRPPAARIVPCIAGALIALALMAPRPAMAGAWPRADGEGFASFHPPAATIADDAGGPAGLGSLYAEFGATPVWTIGLDAARDGRDDAWTGLAFVRRHLWSGSEGDEISAEIGLGYASGDAGGDMRVRPGVSWGRGFAADWGDGWLAFDAGAEMRGVSGAPILRADFTAGVHAADRLMLILQIQADRRPAEGSSARLAPSAVLEVGEGMHLQLSFSAGVVNDRSAKVTLGTWLKF